MTRLRLLVAMVVLVLGLPMLANLWAYQHCWRWALGWILAGLLLGAGLRRTDWRWTRWLALALLLGSSSALAAGRALPGEPSLPAPPPPPILPRGPWVCQPYTQDWLARLGPREPPDGQKGTSSPKSELEEREARVDHDWLCASPAGPGCSQPKPNTEPQRPPPPGLNKEVVSTRPGIRRPPLPAPVKSVGMPKDTTEPLPWWVWGMAALVGVTICARYYRWRLGQQIAGFTWAALLGFGLYQGRHDPRGSWRASWCSYTPWPAYCDRKTHDYIYRPWGWQDRACDRSADQCAALHHFWRDRCDHKEDGEACWLLGLHVRQGHGERKDEFEAQLLFQRGCERHEWLACSEVSARALFQGYLSHGDRIGSLGEKPAPRLTSKGWVEATFDGERWVYPQADVPRGEADPKEDLRPATPPAPPAEPAPSKPLFFWERRLGTSPTEHPQPSPELQKRTGSGR